MPVHGMQAMKIERQAETILVVEDNLDIRALVRMFLERAGYTVVTADDGEEGLRAYEKHQSSIALLLTDVAMPNMNGVDLADRVLQFDSQLPVLFVSADIQNAKRCRRCLQKPFNSVDLVGMVGQVLDESDRRRE